MRITPVNGILRRHLADDGADHITLTGQSVIRGADVKRMRVPSKSKVAVFIIPDLAHRHRSEDLC